MTELLKQCKAIRKEYPETITKEQFYKLAHIGKSTAEYLLQSGLVPCVDNGKQTRRYTIRTEDVIFYLVDREIQPKRYRVPEKWRRKRQFDPPKRVTYCDELSALTDEQREALRLHIEPFLEPFDDLMTVRDVEASIGYCYKSVHRWCNTGKVKAFCIGRRYLIPKICLLDFLSSQASFDIQKKTLQHLFIVKTFLDTIEIQ